MQKKILLIEDNKEISQNIKDYLELEDFIVDRAFDGEEGLSKSLERKYDLILLDLMLPKIDGITIAKKVQRKTKIPIIMITAKDSLSDKLTGFESGAIDYIVKPFDLRELEARIKAILRMSHSDIIEIGDVKIHFKKREFFKEGKKVKITTKEFLIFEFLFKNKNRVITRTDIIEYIWGEKQLFKADGKLDVYISILRKKLGKEIIETVKGVGYKMGE